MKLIYSILVRRSSSVVSNVSTATGSTSEENLSVESVENITESIFAEASESYNQRSARDGEARTPEGELTEEEQIIREMDRDLPTTSSESNLRHRRPTESQPSTSAASESQQNEEDKISIKLKYLNDEIKTVSAYLNESVGNFKR